MKKCLNCRQDLDLEDFGTDQSREDLKNPYCKVCCRDKMAGIREVKHAEGLAANEAMARLSASERAIERNRLKREREARIEREIKDQEINEPVEPLSFAYLGFQLGRIGNRISGWSCPKGIASR